MKRFYILFVMFVMLGNWLNVTSAQDVVQIPDAGLAAIVQINLGLDPEEPITQQELQKLIVLDINRELTDLSDVHTALLDAIRGGAGIKDLTGLEYATNLQSVNLPSNAITDITPLTQLTQLRALGLRDNKVSDLTLFAQLTQLVVLELNDNQIRDVTPLAQLTQLSFLGMARNQIRDITPLAQLTRLSFLDISDNPISDLMPLAQLTQLSQLLAGFIQTRDITPLAQLTELCWLFLDGNQIRDITPLTKLTELRDLGLSDNQISDIALLARFTHLEYLELAANQIRDITPLTKLTELTILGLSDNRISDIAPLARFTHLESLDLSANRQLSDIGAIVHLVKLTTLGIPEHLSVKAAPIVALRAEQKAMKLPEVTVYRERLLPSREHNNCPVPQGLGFVEVDAATRPPMYWSDTATDTLSGLTKDDIELLIPTFQNATSFAVDVSAGKLYWTEKTSETTGKIWRANLDGSNIEVVKDLTSVPLGIAIDTLNGTLYLTNSWGKIQRMNRDGSNFQPNFITDLEAPQHIALDVAGGKLYWTEKTGDTTGRIRRANLDGSNIELVKELNGVLLGIALDTENGTLYLTNAQGKIQRMNLNGTDFQPDFIIGLEAPKGIAVSGDKIYWIEGHRIRRASLNGENIEDAVTGLSSPSLLVLGIPTPSDDMPSPREVPEPITDTPADVNKDGKVNKADLLLVATALGETAPTNPRLDVDSDGTVAIVDLLLVVENLDDPGVGAAPTLTGAPTAIDPQVLAEHLNLLRMTSDGSVRYLRAIAFLEGMLAATRPIETRLLANYPNPFNPETWIPYQLATDADVQILIYDAQGVLVRRLVLGYQPAGYYTGSSAAAYWDGRNSLGERVASGVYFYQLLTDEASPLRKMVILK